MKYFFDAINVTSPFEVRKVLIYLGQKLERAFLCVITSTLLFY